MLLHAPSTVSYSLISNTMRNEVGGAPTLDTRGANLLVVATGINNPILPLSDSQGNVWVTWITGGRLAIQYCIQPNTTAFHTFTVPGASYSTIAISAWARRGRGGPVADQRSSASGGTTIAIPTVTPSEDISLAVTACCGVDYSGVPAIGDPFITLNAQATGTSGNALAHAYVILSKAQALSPAWSISNSGFAGMGVFI